MVVTFDQDVNWCSPGATALWTNCGGSDGDVQYQVNCNVDLSDARMKCSNIQLEYEVDLHTERLVTISFCHKTFVHVQDSISLV